MLVSVISVLFGALAAWVIGVVRSFWSVIWGQLALFSSCAGHDRGLLFSTLHSNAGTGKRTAALGAAAVT